MGLAAGELSQADRRHLPVLWLILVPLRIDPSTRM
jgi:hypothetical protein